MQRISEPLVFAVVALLYFLGSRIGSILPYADTTVALIRPSTGIAFAAVWLFGRPAVAGILLGAFLVDFTLTEAPGFSFMAALGNTLPTVAAYRLLRGSGIRELFKAPPEFCKFLGAAVLAGPLLSAAIGTLSLWINGRWAADGGFPGVVRWAGDALGVLLVAPPLLAWREQPLRMPSRTEVPELALLGFTCLLFVRFLLLPASVPGAAFIDFAALPLIVWAALRFSLAIVTLVVTGLAAAAISATTLDLGPFAQDSFRNASAHLYLFLFAIAGVGSALAVSVQASRRALKDADANSERLAVALRSIGEGLVAADTEGRLTLMNAAAEGLTGWQQDAALNRPIGEIVKLADTVTGRPVEFPIDRVIGMGTQHAPVQQSVLVARDGSRREIAHSAAPMRDGRDRLTGAVMVLRDVSREHLLKKAEARIAGQAHILAQVAGQARLDHTLAELARFVEQLEPTLRCTIMLADIEAGILRHGAGPSMPASYNRAVDGLRIGEGQGSCGTAAARGAPVIVIDVTTDPLWAEFRELAADHDIRACWSFPIRSAQGELLGTFALCWRTPHSPVAEEADLLGYAASLAAVVIARDRDARRLRDSEEQFRATFEHAAVGVAHLGLDGRWLRVNGKLCEILGYPAEKLLARSIQDISHPDDRHEDRESSRRILSGASTTAAVEKCFRCENGQRRWTQLTFSLVRQSSGEPRYFIAVIEDISDKKRTLEQIQNSRDRLARQQAALLSLMDNETFLLTEPDRALGLLSEIAARAMEVQRVNAWCITDDGAALRCLAEFNGGSGPGTVGKELPAARYPGYFEAVSRLRAVVADDVRAHPACRELLDSHFGPAGVGATLDVPVRLFGRFCGILCFEHMGPPRHWTEADRYFALSLANLVSLVYEHAERRRAEAALRASELSLRETLHNAPNVAIQWFGGDGRVLYWNPASQNLYGWSSEEVLGKSPDQFMLDTEQAEVFRDAITTVLRTHRPVGPIEYLARHRNGSPRVVLSTLFAIPGETGGAPYVVCMDVDATGQKRNEAALRHRDRILEMVAFTTERLLSTADWAEELHPLFAHLGVAADVDRVSLFENTEEADEIWSYRRFEWTEPGLLGVPGNEALQSLPLREAGFGRWIETLGRGSVIAGKPHEFPEEERQLLAAGNTLSLAVAPIFCRQRWWGFIAFSDTRSERDWSPVELDAFKAVANNLGTAIGRQQAEASLRLAATAFETSEGIMITDARGTILRVNHAVSALTGYGAEELVGKTPDLLKSGRHGPAFYRAARAQLREYGHWEGEIWSRSKTEEEAPRWASVKPVTTEAGSVTHYVATFLDISERKRAEQEILQLAYYDPLTGLPNRRLLGDRLQHAIAKTRRDGSHGALMFVDLDHFKHLNDALGHLVGDLLLKQVAGRMRDLVRENDSIGRLGGDEFVVLLEDLSAQPENAANQARRVAEKIVEALNCPFLLGEHEHHVSGSVGVVIFPDDGVRADDILKRADTAMYRAKAGGRNTVRFFESSMQAAAEQRLILEKALRSAVANREFAIYLQPQLAIGGKIRSAEALLRWARPGVGLTAPADFLAVAEESGLIVPLGEWVLESVCRLLRTQAEAGRPMGIAVNISPRELRRPDFVTWIRTTLDRTAADPALLTLELTEDAVIEDVAEIAAKMAPLHALGVRFAIDRFGVGRSSLACLRQLPICEIKIDPSFVVNVSRDPGNAALIDAILAMGERLALKVIAQGVESQEQAQFLAEHGCCLVQGFLYGPPLPAAEFLAAMREKSMDSAAE